jgi:hypothetical protein
MILRNDILILGVLINPEIVKYNSEGIIGIPYSVLKWSTSETRQNECVNGGLKASFATLGQGEGRGLR